MTTSDELNNALEVLWKYCYTVFSHQELVCIQSRLHSLDSNFKFFIVACSDKRDFFNFFAMHRSNEKFSLLVTTIQEFIVDKVTKDDANEYSKVGHKELLKHYKSILNDQPLDSIHNHLKLSSPYLTKTHLLWMIDQASNTIDSAKANRWLGYIQGVLAERGVLDMKKEIDISRKFLQGT